jgi:fucose permease
MHIQLFIQGSFIKVSILLNTKIVSIPASAVTKKRSIKLKVVGGLFMVIVGKHDQY